MHTLFKKETQCSPQSVTCSQRSHRRTYEHHSQCTPELRTLLSVACRLSHIIYLCILMLRKMAVETKPFWTITVILTATASCLYCLSSNAKKKNQSKVVRVGIGVLIKDARSSGRVYCGIRKGSHGAGLLVRFKQEKHFGCHE